MNRSLVSGVAQSAGAPELQKTGESWGMIRANMTKNGFGDLPDFYQASAHVGRRSWRALRRRSSDSGSAAMSVWLPA